MRLQAGLFSLVVVVAAGCGGTPIKEDPIGDKPPVKVEKKVDGIPVSAVTAFAAGVDALQVTPPNFVLAAESFEKATGAYNEYTVAWLNQAYSYERLGRYADAVKAYRKLIDQNVTDRGVNLALGRALLLSGEPDQAITEFESVLRTKNDDLQARNNLAAAYLKKGDSATSLRYVKEVLAVQPKNVPAIVNLGLIYLAQNKLPLALLMFQKAINFEPNNARAHNNLGLTYFQLEQVPSAVVEFEKAISLDATMDDARLNVASIYLDYLDYRESLKQFQAVRARFPQHFQAMVGEANSLFGTGEYETAAKVYEESLAIGGDDPEVLRRAGKIYEEQLGQPKKAIELYKRFAVAAKLAADDPFLQNLKFLEEAANAPPPPPDEGGGEGDGGEAPPTGDGMAPPPGDAPPADGAAGDAPPVEGAQPADGAAPADGTQPAADAPPADGES